MSKSDFIPNVHVWEKDIAEAREILGDAAKDMTDEQIRHQIACISYLVETWLEEYERKVFNGKTVNEITSGILDPLDEDDVDKI